MQGYQLVEPGGGEAGGGGGTGAGIGAGGRGGGGRAPRPSFRRSPRTRRERSVSTATGSWLGSLRHHPQLLSEDESGIAPLFAHLNSKAKPPTAGTKLWH